MQSAEEGFPWDRLTAARHYLYTVKPWWHRFGDRMNVVPISVPAPQDSPYGAFTSTDPQMNVYVDRTFATNAPMHVLAGAWEHELQRHVRGTWSRMQWLDPIERERWAGICLELEINSSIRKESARLDMRAVRIACERSLLFPLQQMQKWRVEEPPGLDELGWQPSKVGLPDGLSAEEYYRLLTQPELLPPDDGDGPGEATEGEKQGPDGDSPSADTPSSESGPAVLQSPDEGDEGSGNSPLSEGGVDPMQPQDQEYSEAEGAIDAIGDASVSEGVPTEEDEGLAEDGTDEGEGVPEGTPPASPPEGPSPAELVDQLSHSSPSHSWWSRDTHSAQTPTWKEDAPAVGGQGEQARQELVEDIQAAGAAGTGWGTSPGSSLISWTQGELRRTKADWRSVLSKIIVQAVNSVTIKGSSDLSYSVRNPNQASLGPVLMGMHGYAPSVYVVQDVSGSMRRYLDTSLSSFRELVTVNMGRFGQPATWITVDTQVQDVGRATAITRDMTERWKRGYGGTVMDEVLSALVTNKFRFGRQRYPRPHILILATDCQFSWPWMDSPPRGVRVVVASVSPYAQVRHRLPPWVREGREFVFVQ